jgi:hypothetical protein
MKYTFNENDNFPNKWKMNKFVFKFKKRKLPIIKTIKIPIKKLGLNLMPDFS